MVKKEWRDLLLLSAISVLVGIFIGTNFIDITADYQSKCYTNLEPSAYFSAKPFYSVGRVDLEGNSYMKIDSAGDEILDYDYTTGTGSMRPMMKGKTILLYINSTRENTFVGDIIMFSFGDNRTVHRIVEITGEGYVTKGDNNAVRDEEIVRQENVDGKVVGVLW